MHSSWATLYGDVHDFCLYFAGYHSLALWYYKQNPPYGNESMLVPMDRSMFDETWSHLAVVVEHPRCRIYHNGELVRDAYLPVPAIANRTTARQVIGKDTPMDLDEFRLYRRALSAEEIAAHAAGREIDPPPTQELAVEPNWYDQVLTLRLVGKNADYAGHTAEFSLDGPSQTIPMETTSSRFTATAEFPLHSGAQSIVVRLLDGDDVVATVSRDVELSKPDWIHSTEGIPQTAPAPWTAVEASTSGTKVTVAVLGRTYEFDGAPWPRQIDTGGEALLVAPIKLTGRADGEAIVWGNSRNDLAKHSDLVAVLEHQRESDALELSVETAIEFDGYAIIDCTLTATQDV
jgi:hypothetical protein